VAFLSDVPAAHRDIAARFPHLENMTGAEAAHRAAHIHRLEQRCPVTGELRDITMAHIKRLADALPVGEYLEQLRHLHEMAMTVGGASIDSPAHDFRRAAEELRSGNMYVPGLVQACERFLVHKDPLFDECDIGAVLGAMEVK
jgi:hypothetical protein